MDWDEAQYFPAEIFEQAGALGFMGMLIPRNLRWFWDGISRIRNPHRNDFNSRSLL